MTGSVKVSVLPWPVALPAAVLVHVAALSLCLSVANGSAGRNEISPADELLGISLNDPESEPQPEIVRVGAADIFQIDAREFAARLAGPKTDAPTAAPTQSSSLEASTEPRATTREPVTTTSTRDIHDALASDAPLDAGTLSAGETAASGSSNGSSNSNVGTGEASGTGDGVSGQIASSGQGGKDLFSRVANQMVGEHQRASFALKGQPSFPRACRQGLCRRGTPCEGSSEWRVTVGAAGGAPTKIEAITVMECELQNASIRKFFSEYNFPKSERTRIYIFPVKMRISQ